jgi:hypothetical protein
VSVLNLLSGSDFAVKTLLNHRSLANGTSVMHPLSDVHKRNARMRGNVCLSG